jgi:hypothetical protein
MPAHNNDVRGAIIAGLIAIAGTMTLFFFDFEAPGAIPQNSISMITAAAAQRADATVFLPSR